MSKPPDFMEQKPEPILDARWYHGNKQTLWRGKVNVSEISGWEDNPRLDLEITRWREDNPGGKIKQDDLFAIMKEDGLVSSKRSIRLKELADDISNNGVREPIVLTYSGRLLDGNRRFFAVKYAIEHGDGSRKRDLELIPAFVLLEDAIEQDMQDIIVEENFSSSLKREWSYYVKARAIQKERDEAGKSIEDIAKRFGWSPRKVRESLKICEFMDAFIAYATEDSDLGNGGLNMADTEAEFIAAEKYQHFNEAYKSFRDPLTTDYDFAIWFYGLISKDVFKRFDEVRCAHKAYSKNEYRAILNKENAAEIGAGDTVKMMIRLEEKGIENLQRPQKTIEKFLNFLNNLKTAEIATISDDSLGKLKEALTFVQKLIEAAKK